MPLPTCKWTRRQPINCTCCPFTIQWFIIYPPIAFRIAFAEGNELPPTRKTIVDGCNARGIAGVFVILAGSQSNRSVGYPQIGTPGGVFPRDPKLDVLA